MDTQGYIIVFGWLLTCIGVFIVGFIMGDTALGIAFRIIGGGGLMAWVFFLFFLLRAMNTDI